MDAKTATRIPGIIGGIAPESTIDYYRQIIAAYRERVPGYGAPPILINSIDLAHMIGYVEAGDLAGLAAYLLEELGRLARAGADFGLLASNTPHLVFDELSARSPLPLISIVEATRDAAAAVGIRRAGLFGTRFTMQASFYADVFGRKDIAVVVPTPEEQAYLHERYMTELVQGRFLDETRAKILAIADRLRREQGIEALILGGTELPLALRGADPPGLRLLDTTRCHVDRVIERMLGA